MSIIPDTRTDEFYNQKYLKEIDAEFVAGFDYCLQMGVLNAFDNLDGMDEEIEEDFKIRNHPEVINAFKNHLKKWIEMQRDDLITSMIENMGLEELEDRKTEIDEGKVKENCLSFYSFETEPMYDWDIEEAKEEKSKI